MPELAAPRAGLAAPAQQAEPIDADNSARWLPWSITGFLAVLVAWAAVAEVNETAIATGHMIAPQPLLLINRPDGGVVTAIFVHAGDRILAGQRLLQLDVGLPPSKQRRVLYSPASGTVNRVIAAMGAAGGEPLIALVPTDGPIAFAARVRPRDIGIIHLGQRATIRVTARDSRIFGPLVGHVTRIAGDATSDQRNGERWYDIRIETAAYSLTGPDGRRVTIAADMVAEVSLPGAPRTVLSYVLASIFNASNTAIRAPSR